MAFSTGGSLLRAADAGDHPLELLQWGEEVLLQEAALVLLILGDNVVSIVLGQRAAILTHRQVQCRHTLTSLSEPGSLVLRDGAVIEGLFDLTLLF